MTLEQRRKAETFDLQFSGNPLTVTIGRHENGTIGEVFIDAHKRGTAVDTMAREAAVLISLALQHGATPDVLLRALPHRPPVGAVITDIRDHEGAVPEGMAGVVLSAIMEAEPGRLDGTVERRG